MLAAPVGRIRYKLSRWIGEKSDSPAIADFDDDDAEFKQESLP
jgi:hypothetical protein